MGNIIVTGGAGFIGSHLVDRLIDQGQTVIIIDDLSTGKTANLNPKALVWHGCVDKVISSNKEISIIFHLAAVSRIQPSFEHPFETYKSNSTGTMAMLELARKHGAKLVYAGSSTACDAMLNPYAFFKYQGEECCKFYSKLYGLSTVIARFFNVYGPRQLEEGDFATVLGIWERQYRNKLPLTITGDGWQRRDFIHVDDIVDGLIAMSVDKWNGETFDLGSGINYSLNEIVKMFKDAEVRYIPTRPGEIRATLADITNTTNILNWRPKKCLTEYCAAITPNC